MSYTAVKNSDTLTLYLGVCGTGKATASSTSLTNFAGGTVYNPRSFTFEPSDVGMPIAIVGGGPVDPDMPPIYFVQGALFHTTIAAYVSPTEVTLTDAPDTGIYNTGFATVILYRPCPIASDVANVPTQFQFNSSIAPGTNDTMQFSTLNSSGAEDNPYVDRFGAILLGQPVYLTRTDPTDGVVEVFGGYIDTLTTSSMPGVPGTPYSWSAQCVSWSGLARRVEVPPTIPQTFSGVAGDVVFKKLVLDYLENDGAAVTAASAPDITLAAPVGANVGQLLDQVVSLISTEDTAWYWTTDAWRTFILATRATITAPWSITSGDDLFAGNTPYQQSIVATHNQMANFVYVIGTQTLLNTLNAVLVGNGSATTFNLPEPVGAVPTITLNSGSQTVGILGVDTGKNWYWSQGSNVLTQDSGGTVLNPTDTLAVSYTPLTPAVAQAPNVGSLQQLQAIEGTGANYTHAITLSQPILPADLLAFATAYEIEYGEPATTCQLYTLRPGLATGQLQSISLPDAGIPSGDYLIATLQMSTLDGVIVWQYTAFGGANIGDALTALTQFINRDQAELSIITPTTPITGAATPAATGNFASGPSRSGTPNITLPNTVTEGNLIVVVASAPLNDPCAVADSQGNTYTQVIFATNPGFFPHRVAILYTFATATGPLTVGSIDAFAITIGEFTGINPLGPVDTSAGQTLTPPTITVANANNIVVTGMNMDSSATTPTVTSPEALMGFTLGGGGAGDNAGSYEVTAAGSFTSTLGNGATNPIFATVSFNRASPTAPPVQTTTVLANPQGTVTHSVGLLTAGKPVVGHGGGDVQVGTKTSTNNSTNFATAEPISTPSGGEPAIWNSSSNLQKGVFGLYVPSGGTTGQVLTKNSATDYDDAWATPAAGPWTDDGTEVYVTGRQVGINTATPGAALEVKAQSTNRPTIWAVSSNANGPASNLYNTNLPTTGAGLGIVNIGYVDGSNSGHNSAAITALATENWTAGSAQGSEIEILVTPNGTATAQLAVMITPTAINIPSGSTYQINGVPIGGGGGGNTISYGAYASLPGSGSTAGDLYICTDSPYEFVWTGSAWQARIFGYNVTPPVLSAFTQVNVDKSTFDTTHGGILQSLSNSGSSLDLQVLTQAIPGSGAYYVDAAFIPLLTTNNGAAGAGLTAGNLTSSAVGFTEFGYDNTTALIAERSIWNSTTSFNSSSGQATIGACGPLVWTRVYDDRTTNRKFSISMNGYTWIDLLTEARTTVFTPAEAALVSHSYNSTVVLHWVHFSIHG